jgi:hypothetical protein
MRERTMQCSAVFIREKEEEREVADIVTDA